MGKVHLSEIISSVELYRFNIGGGLFSEWEKYISVKLYPTFTKLERISVILLMKTRLQN